MLQCEGMNAGGLLEHWRGKRGEVDSRCELLRSEAADGLGVDGKRVGAGREAGELQALLVESFVEVGGLDCERGERVFCVDWHGERLIELEPGDGLGAGSELGDPGVALDGDGLA